MADEIQTAEEPVAATFDAAAVPPKATAPPSGC